MFASQMAEGPYWIDARRNRASLTAGITSGSVMTGTTMSLTIQLYDNNGPTYSSNPAHDVQVDIWHCDANGVYSGIAACNTLGEDFLRGYQVTNSEGRVTFTTIYPGWHEGRATHICLRARVYDSLGNTTYNFVSRLFFDDGFSDEIYLMAPYNLRGSRDTRNNSDMIYRGANTPPLVTAEYTTAETGTELVAEVAIGLSGLPATGPHRHCA
jgi:protocatechuate 3,4-dioxygenase beta subunit